jgi:hypothetical protein
MRFKNIFIIFLILILTSNFAIAQKTPAKKDSTKIYKNIETYSRQSRFKSFAYGLVFKPVTAISSKSSVKKKTYKKLIQKPYSSFEGKPIRNINIVTLDPFGYSATDTTVGKRNVFTKTGNIIHIKTQNITIRNLLLIRKNMPFNSLRVKESERLIRLQKFVHEVYFYVVTAGRKSDSIDIFIRVLDKWSIIPKGSISATGIRVDINEENFLGSGHGFQGDFKRNFKNGIDSTNIDYFIPNIDNTYINAKLHYGVDGDGNFNRSLAVNRPFFSPLAKWAAGASFSNQSKKDSLKGVNLVYVPINLKFNTQDYWVGKAIPVFKNKREDERITKLILTLGYYRMRFSEKPTELIDPEHIYSNEDFYLTGIGISTRKYVQDKYIFSNGVTEDVPEGKVYELTGGYQVRNNSGRFYLGMRYSFGNYYEWGYLSSDFEYGTFFKSSHTEQGVFTAGINYFTGLIEIGDWKFRQFIKPQVIIGINRFSYDSLTLNDGYGLNGFNSPQLTGTKRLLFTLQTQSYAPWNLLGFHFGPYLMCSLGILGDDAKGFKNNKVYSLLGLGVLIKNENLVFSSFQISISFYPVIPGIGQDIFKMNSFSTTDFGFRDFEIKKPAAVVYQ